MPDNNNNVILQSQIATFSERIGGITLNPYSLPIVLDKARKNYVKNS